MNNQENKTGVTSILETIAKNLEARKVRGAWNNAVNIYAQELIEAALWNNYQPANMVELNRMLLNGAQNWSEFSWGGSSLIYNQDIAERTCSPSELKKVTNKKGLRNKPNAREHWLDVQARALYQAAMLIAIMYNGIVHA